MKNIIGTYKYISISKHTMSFLVEWHWRTDQMICDRIVTSKARFIVDQGSNVLSRHTFHDKERFFRQDTVARERARLKWSHEPCMKMPSVIRAILKSFSLYRSHNVRKNSNNSFLPCIHIFTSYSNLLYRNSWTWIEKKCLPLWINLNRINEIVSSFTELSHNGFNEYLFA